MDKTSPEEVRKFNRAKSVGQLHYKSISLKLQMREVQIMRQVWGELEKTDKLTTQSQIKKTT
jgi:hypothetical protein